MYTLLECLCGFVVVVIGAILSVAIIGAILDVTVISGLKPLKPPYYHWIVIQYSYCKWHANDSPEYKYNFRRFCESPYAEGIRDYFDGTCYDARPYDDGPKFALWEQGFRAAQEGHHDRVDRAHCGAR